MDGSQRSTMGTLPRASSIVEGQGWQPSDCKANHFCKGWRTDPQWPCIWMARQSSLVG